MKKVLGSLVVIVLLVVLLGYQYLEKQSFRGAVSGSNVSQQFEIKEGDGSKEIGEKLAKAGLVKNKYYFYYYVWKTKTSGKVQAGLYELAPNMTIGEMVEKFTQGDIVQQIVKITIPEGFTNKKIIARLREKKPELADEFENLVSCQCLNQPACACDKFTQDYPFLQEVPNGVDLEGYLFPDTYFIEKDDTAESLVRKFLNNFSKKISGNLVEEINKQDKSLYQIVSMASLIEKEAKNETDMKIVSGIFWKRIQDSMPLQSCATLAYITGVDKEQYDGNDIAIQSPYNTYLNPGLPVGPVSNPGIATITAAIFPQATDYYFFLTDPKTKEMVYSKTGQEHAENKAKHGL